jgi:transcriptional regulator with XRE-family HTH domain
VTLSDRLKRLFDERGVSISEAARFAGMEKQQVHRIVSGRNANPGIATVRRIVEGIGGTLGELFADEDERPA